MSRHFSFLELTRKFALLLVFSDTTVSMFGERIVTPTVPRQIIDFSVSGQLERSTAFKISTDSLNHTCRLILKNFII